MADIFLSYSLQDQAFVRKLHQAFVDRGYDVWIDWHNIPATADWRREINAGIDAAANFVFVISPDSLASSICVEELQHAVSNHKRIIAILHRDVSRGTFPPPLADLQSIPEHIIGFDETVRRAVVAIDTDVAWLREHARLLLRSKDWDASHRATGRLLRGEELLRAREWLNSAPPSSEAVAPHVLQSQFILASEYHAGRRKQRWLGVATTSVVILAGLTWMALKQRASAIEQRQIAVSGELAVWSEALRKDHPNLLQRSVLLAAESLRHWPGVTGDQALRQATGLLPRKILSTDPGHVLAMSPDGRQLAVATDDAVRVIDVAAGRIVATHAVDRTQWLGFLLDDGALVAVDGAGTVEIWNRENETQHTTLSRACAVLCRAVATSSTRNLLAFDADHKVNIWRVKPGEPTRMVASFVTRGIVTALAFSPDGTVLASASAGEQRLTPQGPSEIRLWDVDTRAPLVEATLVPDVVVAIRVRANPILDLTTASRSFAGPTKMYATYRVEDWFFTQSGLQSKENAVEHQVSSLVLDGSGSLAAGPMGDGVVRVWQGATEVARVPLEPFRPGGATDPVLQETATDLAFSPDGRQLVVAAALVDTFELLDPPFTLKVAPSPSALLKASADAVKLAALPTDFAFAPTGTWLASVEDGGRTLSVRVPHTLKPVWQVHGTSFTSVVFDPSGDYVAALDNKNQLMVWRLADGTVAVRMDAPEVFAFGAGHDLILYAARDHTVHARQVSSAAEVRKFTYVGSDGRFSQSGRYFAERDGHQTFRVWDTSTGRQMLEIAHGGTLTFSPDDQYVATAAVMPGGSDDTLVRAWRLPGDEAFNVRIHGVVNQLALSADGRLLAAATGATVMWAINSGREVLRIPLERPSNVMLSDIVTAVAFSRDGRYIATSDNSNSHVWDATTGRELARFDFSFNVGFSPDSRYVLFNQAPTLWRTDDVVTDACSRLTVNLTPQEWREYLRDEPYRKTCPNLP